MDVGTMILALAIGSFAFGCILLLFQFGKDRSRRIPFWVSAKFLQGAGSLLLFFRDSTPEFASVSIANSLLLCGCAYECWAVFHITGRAVRRRLHLAATGCIVTLCVGMLLLNAPGRIAVDFLLHGVWYALPGWALLSARGHRSRLRVGLGWSFWTLALVFSTRGFWTILVPAQSHVLFGMVILQIMLPAVYCMMLISGFSMLLLAKEKTDRELQGALLEQKAILETLPTGLCILHDRVIERCNPAMETIFGFLPGTLVGRPTDCLYENEEASAAYRRVIYGEIERNGGFAGELVGRRQSGELFWVWAQGTSIFPDRDKSYVVLSMTDITHQKMQQELLVRGKEELEAANQTKRQFQRMVAHEFGTPLGLLATSTDILERYWKRLATEEREEQLNRIRSAAQQIATLTSSILSHDAGPAGGGGGVGARPVNLGELSRTIATEAETVWSNGHLFTVAIAEDLGSAPLDEHLFRRVLQNLLSNAFRYTQPDGAVSLEISREGDRLLLEVADSGIGIGQEDQKRIFDAYYRGGNVGTRRGLGLGLSIVHEALELLGGDVTVISCSGKGTAMLLDIPLTGQPS